MKVSLLSLIIASFFITGIYANATEKMVFMYENTNGEKSLWLQSQRALQKIEVGFSFAIYPSLAKDASELAYVAGTDEKSLNIYIKNLQNGEQQQITETKGFVLHPHLSGNKRYLAYSEFSQDKNHIVVLDRQTQTTIKIESESSLYFPKLSSSGSFVVYQKNISNDKKEIWLTTLETNQNHKLSDGYSKCMAPNLNMDDSLLAMTCFVEDKWNIYVLNMQNKEIQQITFSSHESFAPTFDRFNNIIFASNESGHFALYKLNRQENTGNYSQPTKIQEMKGDLYAPSVSGNVSYTQEVAAQIPQPARSSFGTIEVNQKIYIFGGHQGQEHTYPPESFLHRLDIYDIANKTWSEGASRPVTAHGYGVEECNGKIYAFGGFSYSEAHKPKWKSLSRIDRYDPKTNTWEYVGDLKEPRSSNVVAKINNKIYLIAGWNSTPKFDNDYEGKFHRDIEIFDCVTERLQENQLQLPNPLRRALTGIVYNEKILLIGGLGEGANHFELLNQVTEFDPRSLTFKELSPLPFATFAPAAGILHGSLHVFGGMFKTGPMAYEYVNHVYALERNSWYHTGRYLTETKGFSMVLNIANQLWVLGGHSYENEADAPVTTIEVWK